VVDGAAVHSLVFEHMLERAPGLSAKLRIIERSPPYGLLPIVASAHLDPAERARLREVLLSIDRDPEASEPLKKLQIERFVVPPPGLYASAERLLEPRR
jgi:phosphonate transport system substrate-binding protein